MSHNRSLLPIVYLLLYLFLIKGKLLSAIFPHGVHIFVSYGVLAFLAAYLFRRELKQSFQKVTSLGWKILWWLLGAYVALVLLGTLGGLLSDTLLGLFGLSGYQLQNDTAITQVLARFPKVLILLVLGVLGPFVEEVVYRHIIFGWCQRVMPYALSLSVQALLFGMIHMHQLSWAEFFSVLPHAMSGLALGYLSNKGQGLWLPWWLHSFENLSAFMMSL